MEKKNISEVIAESLRARMERKGWKTPQLAQQSGVSQRSVVNWLDPGKRIAGTSGKAPSGKIGDLQLLAEALGCGVADLLGLPQDGQPPSGTIALSIGQSEERVELAEVLSDALGDVLQGLPRDLYDRAVTACRRLAESPDSLGARHELLDVLQYTSPAKPVEVSLPSLWREAAASTFDTLSREGKLGQISGPEFIQMVDGVVTAKSARE